MCFMRNLWTRHRRSAGGCTIQPCFSSTRTLSKSHDHQLRIPLGQLYNTTGLGREVRYVGLLLG